MRRFKAVQMRGGEVFKCRETKQRRQEKAPRSARNTVDLAEPWPGCVVRFAANVGQGGGGCHLVATPEYFYLVRKAWHSGENKQSKRGVGAKKKERAREHAHRFHRHETEQDERHPKAWGGNQVTTASRGKRTNEGAAASHSPRGPAKKAKMRTRPSKNPHLYDVTTAGSRRTWAGQSKRA